MTRKLGVPGKTVRALYRAQDAATRQVLRQQRTPEAQLALLDERPGDARRERLRLGYVLLATDPEIVQRGAPEERDRRRRDPPEQPKRHVRRRAVRRAQKSVTITGKATA
jgi:hypothetical protein